MSNYDDRTMGDLVMRIPRTRLYFGRDIMFVLSVLSEGLNSGRICQPLTRIDVWHMNSTKVCQIQVIIGNWIYREAELSCGRAFAEVQQGGSIF
jgi:hypothetical protein